MSTPSKPLTVVIFDRTQAGMSDVPVFAASLKQKVNTPIAREVLDERLSPQALTILKSIQLSNENNQTEQKQIEAFGLEKIETVLRADSSGGQTGEFAQSTDSPKPALLPSSLQPEQTTTQATKSAQVSSRINAEISDEPSLIRLHADTKALTTYLYPRGFGWVTAPSISILRLTTVLLGEAHRNGLQDIVVIPESLISWRTQIEPWLYAARRTLFATIKTVRAYPYQKRRTAIEGKAVQLRDQIRSIQIPTISLPSVSVPKVHRPSMRMPRIPSVHVVRPTFEIPRVSLPRPSFPKIIVPTLPHVEVQQPTIVIPTIVWPEFNFARFTSRVLMAGSLVLMLMTVGPMIALEAQSWKQKFSNAITNIPTRAEDNAAASPSPTATPIVNPDPDKQFQIIIPKIGVNSKVIANVDASSEKDYTEALKKGVAHAAGTGLPGEPNANNKTIFIFGHSTNGEWNIARYNALFYALKDMIVGDTFSVWFWGREYHYTVTETKIVAANDVSFLVPQTSKEQLILQTCWPPGTSWKRFLVIAEPSK